MRFFILAEDAYDQEGPSFCYYRFIKPTVLSTSKAMCPACGANLEPRLWDPPRRARLSARNCGDLIFGAAFELTVSDRFRKAFEEAGLSGIISFGEIDFTPNPLKRYWIARSRATCTRLDENASELVWQTAPTCNVCRIGARMSIKHVVIDEQTWDGSDIFIASGFQGRKIVTEAFVEMVNHWGLQNFIMTPAEEFSEDFNAIYK